MEDEGPIYGETANFAVAFALISRSKCATLITPIVRPSAKLFQFSKLTYRHHQQASNKGNLPAELASSGRVVLRKNLNELACMAICFKQNSLSKQTRVGQRGVLLSVEMVKVQVFYIASFTFD